LLPTMYCIVIFNNKIRGRYDIIQIICNFFIYFWVSIQNMLKLIICNNNFIRYDIFGYTTIYAFINSTNGMHF